MPVHLSYVHSLETPREPPFSFDGVEGRAEAVRHRRIPELFVHAAEFQPFAIAEIDLQRDDAFSRSQRRLYLRAEVHVAS